MQSSELVVPEDRAVRLWLGLGSASAVLFVLTALLVTSSTGVARFDNDLMALMSARRQPFLTSVAQTVTDLGSYRPVAVAQLVLAFLVGLRVRRLLEPVVLLVAVEASSSLVELFKPVIHQARPPTGEMLGAPVFDYSFPSGHAASGTVLYLLGALLLTSTEIPSSGRRLLVAASCVIGGLIGLSRVYLGYHWLTDVVGAWLLAVILTSIGMAFVTAPACRPHTLDSGPPGDAASLILGVGPAHRNLT